MARVLAGAALVLLLVGRATAAQHPVDFAPDITVNLGTGPSLVVNGNNLAHDNGAGGVIGYLIPAGTLPANVHIQDFHPLANHHTLLAVDITTALPGLPPGAPAEPRDVVDYDPAAATFSPYFTGSAAGVPSNAHINGISLDGAGNLQLSFDIATTLPGVGAVANNDVVVYSGGTFASVFKGSAAGVASGVNIDAIHALPAAGALLLSFDVAGTVAGVTFDKADVVSYDTGSGTYSMYFQASLSDPVNWPKANLVALPEPARGPALGAGAALLAIGARCRRKRR